MFGAYARSWTLPRVIAITVDTARPFRYLRREKRYRCVADGLFPAASSPTQCLLSQGRRSSAVLANIVFFVCPIYVRTGAPSPSISVCDFVSVRAVLLTIVLAFRLSIVYDSVSTSRKHSSSVFSHP
ncbi:unnamed protein product [Macrosiphum euphorbiae]|uniref:Uncharacterized protein n=1 Tax=Macrosiphum euphorbiae TaxID=13131 RepID=A0AAV0XY88_9HEMI|nr:unnamed protein product [Macrosiphum euphorbiae]CAI6374538.1 unnamed protein product [Macrosiphum euphorbiae]